MPFAYKHDFGDGEEESFPNAALNREIEEAFCWSQYYDGNVSGDCWFLDCSKRKRDRIRDDELFYILKYVFVRKLGVAKR